MPKFKTITALAGASALALAAGAASAATISVTNITSEWTNVIGGTAVTTTAAGVNPAELRWGIPTSKNPGQKSGYDFLGNAPPPFTVGTGSDFELGLFTHLNWEQGTGTSITGADLKLTFDFDLDGEARSLTSTFRFAHTETPNGSDPCANGGAHGVGLNEDGCADLVKISTVSGESGTIEVDGVNYMFKIAGFEDDSGNPVSEFWTAEQKDNHATLIARLDVAPIPLPAAGWLLLGGLGALGVARRRRKAA